MGHAITSRERTRDSSIGVGLTIVDGIRLTATHSAVNEVLGAVTERATERLAALYAPGLTGMDDCAGQLRPARAWLRLAHPRRLDYMTMSATDPIGTALAADSNAPRSRGSEFLRPANASPVLASIALTFI